MDKEPGWLERLLDLPNGMKAAIALVVEIVGFIVASRSDHYLFATISGVLFVLTLLLVCVNVAFARTPSPFGGKGAYRFEKFRPVAFACIGIISVLAVVTFVYEPSRSFIAIGITGRPTPTPFAFATAQPDETLLIVVDFDNRSSGNIGADPAQRIYNLITEKLPDNNLKLRVEQYHLPVKDTAEAARVLEDYSATILIWGWYDQFGAITNIKLDKDKIPQKILTKIPELSLDTPEDFAIRFTKDVPAQGGYVAFFSLGLLEFNVGENEMATGFFTQAIDTANSASKDAVSPWEALMWRANIYLSSGIYNLAIGDYTEALDLLPNRESFLNRGVAYGVQANYTEAIANYTQAIAIDPDFELAYYNRGATYSAQGEYTQAVDDYSKVIAINPKSRKAYNNRGNAYSAQSKYTEAIADYTMAIEIDPNFKEAYYNRGNAYYYQDKFAEAVADYTKVIEIDLNFKGAYFNRGKAYSAQGKYPEAIDDYSKAIGIDPNFKEAYVNRGIHYGDQGKYSEAIADYTQAIRIDPNFKEAYINRCNAYIAQGKYNEAINDCSNAIEIDPNSKDAYFNRGAAYHAQGKYAEAIDDYIQVIRIDPDDKEAYFNRGNTYSAQGNYAKAIADYTKAIEIDLNYKEAYCNLGITYTRMGDFPSAIFSLEQGVKLDTKSQYPQCKVALDNARLGTPTP